MAAVVTVVVTASKGIIKGYLQRGVCFDQLRHLSRELRHLCRDPCNSVFVLSGKETSWMEWAFAGIPGLGLVAEHGYYWRSDHSASGAPAKDKEEWQTLFGAPIDRTWMPTAEHIMANYVLRTR